MTDKKHTHHAINYVEFVVSDMDAAKRFYASALGWEYNDYGPTYAGIKEGNGEAGGLRLDPETSSTGPLVILYSQDLEASLKAVVEAGGIITKSAYAFPGGRRFHFQDPSGNELAVWSEP